MAKNSDHGPKPEKLPLDKMPLDKLVDVLPPGSPLGGSVTPTVTHTGLTSGYTPSLGSEPYFYDQNTFRLVDDIAPGAGSTQLESLTTLGGTTYIAGWTQEAQGGFDYNSLLARLDPATGAIQFYSGADFTWANGFNQVNGNLYFLEHDDLTRDVRIGLINPTTFQVIFTSLPAGVGGDNLYLSNGKLIVQNVFGSSATDLALYDPANGSVQTIDLGTDIRATSDAGFTQGNKFYFFTTNTGFTSFNLVSLNMDTAQISIEWQNVSSGEPLEGRAFYQTSSFDGDDYVIHVYNTDTNDVSLIKLDNSGTITELSNSTDFRLIAQTATASYWSTNTAYGNADIYKISEDSGGNTVTHLFDLNASGIGFGAVDGNGQLYLGGAIAGDSDWDLLKLDEANSSLVGVNSFGSNDGGYSIHPISDTDGFLAVIVYDQSLGQNQLWTSASPETVSSWHMISGDVFVRDDFNAVPSGDFIL